MLINGGRLIRIAYRCKSSQKKNTKNPQYKRTRGELFTLSGVQLLLLGQVLVKCKQLLVPITDVIDARCHRVDVKILAGHHVVNQHIAYVKQGHAVPETLVTGKVGVLGVGFRNGDQVIGLGNDGVGGGAHGVLPSGPLKYRVSVPCCPVCNVMQQGCGMGVGRVY